MLLNTMIIYCSNKLQNLIIQYYFYKPILKMNIVLLLSTNFLPFPNRSIASNVIWALTKRPADTIPLALKLFNELHLQGDISIISLQLPKINISQLFPFLSIFFPFLLYFGRFLCFWTKVSVKYGLIRSY